MNITQIGIHVIIPSLPISLDIPCKLLLVESISINAFGLAVTVSILLIFSLLIFL